MTVAKASQMVPILKCFHGEYHPQPNIQLLAYRSKSSRELGDGIFESLRRVGCTAPCFCVLPAIRHGACVELNFAVPTFEDVGSPFRKPGNW